MSNSLRIRLPYLDAAQAQKHVTMNEALARLDVVAAARVETMAMTSPPVSPIDGKGHIVPDATCGAWSGQAGKVAVFLNGGWEFIPPWEGWRLWVADETGFATFDGSEWQIFSQPISPGGALTALRHFEVDHAIAPASTSETTQFIPDKAIVLGVTARVITEITGATTWLLGVTGSPDRYGSGFGPGLNGFTRGVTGSPIAYFGGSSLLLTSAGGDFTGGELRIAVHFFDLSPPHAI